MYLNTQSNYDEILIEEFIKGATEFVGEGGCYHHEKTDALLINLKDIVDEIIRFSQVNTYLIHIWDNITKSLRLYSEKTENIFINLNINSGVMISIINIIILNI